MSLAACKVILCGPPAAHAVGNLEQFAAEVMSGNITATPEVEAELANAAAALDKATAALTKAHKALMAAGFPKA